MKLFLAGGEGVRFPVVLHALGYPYRLCSYYYLRDNVQACATILDAARDGSEWTMDSGLFSLMFGSDKGTLSTFDAFRSYALKYLEDVNSWGWKHAIVECDVQKLLGVKETEKLRDEIFRPSGREVIYVWHLPEGEDGLRRLARNEKRIALSVPELRNVYGTGSNKLKTALIRLLAIIKDEGNPRVHLLGNTQSSLVTLPADSGDSTSWLAGGRYGTGYTYDVARRKVETVSVYSPRWRAWRAWCGKHYAKTFSLLNEVFQPGTMAGVYYINACCSAIAFLTTMGALGGERGATPPDILHVRPPSTIDE